MGKHSQVHQSGRAGGRGEEDFAATQDAECVCWYVCVHVCECVSV